MSTTHTPGRLKVQHPHAGLRGFELADEKTGLLQVCQDVTEANARRLVACWNAFVGAATEAIEELGPIAGVMCDPAQSRIFELEAALSLYEAAHESLFTQCCSNPVTNAWGKEVNMSALNDAHQQAQRVLRDRVRQDIARGSRQSNGKLPG